ncbi:MAG: hypothetical protein WAN72_25885 [Candidatus Acidiferrales bacterium]
MRRFRPSNYALWAVCCCTCLRFASPGAAYAQAVQQADETTSSAPAVQLILSTKSSQYYAGEVIPLDLAFSASVPKRYEINNATYDRRGRMEYEQFIVEPKDAAHDPLSVYFNSIAGFIGGGLTSFDFLTSTPKIIHLNLNEWVSFDRPGTYRVSVVSHRVGDSAITDESRGNEIELKSNWIAIRIVVPDPSWQSAQLANARQVLDHTPQPPPPVQDPAREAAMAQLRYLGTEAAAREMARRLRGDDNNGDVACVFGLIASPHRDAGLAEMNRLFTAPDFPVSANFLLAMSILPLDPAATPETLRAERERNYGALQQRLVSVLPQKRGKAAATSLEALLSDSRVKTSDEVRKQLVPQLIGAFRALPVDQQAFWLQYRWDAIKDPQWLPLLRGMALQFKDYSNPREMAAYQSLLASGAALERWYELDPDGARDAVINEISRPKPRYGADVLGILPDKVLPEVEDQLAQHFLATDDYEVEGRLASLLFRYADSEEWPAVASKVTENIGTWACDPQDKMLAYALRVDPEVARPLLERAIAARGPDDNACRHTIFSDVGTLQADRVLEELALKSLTDADLEVAQDAARYLSNHGSAAAEQPLWDRYEAWNTQWKGGEQELRVTYATRNPNSAQLGLGQSLALALADGLGWLSDERKLQRIAGLGVGPYVSLQAERALQEWSELPRKLTCWTAGDTVNFHVAQYDLHSVDDLKTKLGQFPEGSQFLWSTFDSNNNSGCEKSFADISEFAQQHGCRLQRTPSRPVE